jgi:hypothetical protein
MQRMDPPTDRTCERCGRSETWDNDRSSWTIVEESDGKRVGDVYCLHNWDINGAYNPIE